MSTSLSNPPISSNLDGSSLLVAWQLKGKTVLIVGGGEVASGRIEAVLSADAKVVVLAPAKGLHPRTKRFIELCLDHITYYDRHFSGPAELHKMDMVLTALDDPNSSRQIVELCREQRIPVNAADIPDLCDFYFGAQIRDGPLQIMISTNGSSPRIAALLKAKLSSALGGYEGESIRRVGELRDRLKDRAPGIGGAVSRRRMKWMSQLCNEWDMEELTQLDDSMIVKLLDEGWEQNRVPSVHDVGGKSKLRRGRLSKDVFQSTFQDFQAIPYGGSTVLPAALGFLAGGVSVAMLFMYHRQ
ncbi:siroheme synthase [Guyanagaster necrorhizus]|uniref:precorrin-2 dehydrogenase n=1 Tax=Guyanagaster necrorhizus TaxID=856835 RepID=A0A9P8AVI0_9AGAR|nr:siroheme synthase [Guyanagaster necrorhizus MCA 3950]KAG7447937.1 siroheme synthase [Guyanagaster necrorhizus MCA 3950]